MYLFPLKGSTAISTICATLLMSMGPVNIGIAQSKFWMIKAEQFQCVVNNINAYMKVPSQKVIIFLNECPETDLEKIIAGNVTNSVLPEVEKKEQDAQSPAEVISIDKDSVHCLANVTIPNGASVVRVPKNPCR